MQRLPAKVDLQNHCIAILALGEEKQCLFLIGSRRKSTNVCKQEAEITGLAWECLRRNPHYQREHDEIVGHDHGVTADFRRRWGVCFRG